MTAAVYRSGTPSLSIPQTQNTAPVLEFNCLYTHDLRKKQKKWHDGFLRFHTFNKRIMVYDVPRNYIGDMHWTAGEVLQEGDELMLEKGGAMVEVADAIGRTETDLTELRASRKKPTGGNGSSPARAPQIPAVRGPSMTASRPGTALKHRSLNALLGTPKGQVGKAALPTKSPFELRHAGPENDTWNEGRSPKRQRIERPPAVNMNHALAAKSKLITEKLPLWARTTDAAQTRQRAHTFQDQQRAQPKEIVELEDDEPASEKFLPGFSSDALAPPSSPPKDNPRKAQAAPPARSSSPAFQTQKPVTKRVNQPPQMKKPSHGSTTAATTFRKTPSMEDLPDCNTTGKDSRIERETTQAPQLPPLPLMTSPSEATTSKKPGSGLRIAASAPKKKMLVCQDQLATKCQPSSKAPLSNPRDFEGEDANDVRDSGSKTKTQRQLLDERLKRLKTQSNPATKAAGIRSFSKTIEPMQVSSKTGRHSRETQDVGLETTMHNSSSFMDIDSVVPQSLVQEETPRDKHTAGSRADLSRISDDHISAVEQTHSSATAVEDMADISPDAQQQGFPMGDESKSDPRQSTSAESAPPRRKKGIGRKEICKSAESCFQPAVEGSEQAVQATVVTEMRNRADSQPTEPRLVADNDEVTSVQETETIVPAAMSGTVQESSASSTEHAIVKPKRTPGLPMRFTPSPQKQAQVAKQSEMSKAPSAPIPQDRAQMTKSQAESAKTTAAPPFAKPALPASRKFNRKAAKQPVALNTTTSGTAAVMLGRPFQAPKKTKAAPKVAAKSAARVAATEVAMTANAWSREAGDLFDWRPPGWDEERWCLKDVADALDETTKT